MHPGLLVLGGFLLGTAGVKAVKSRPAHRFAVRATVCGLQAKEYVEHVVDETKAQCDDIMAEAEELKAVEDAVRDSDTVVIEDTCVCADGAGDAVVSETVVEKDA